MRRKLLGVKYEMEKTRRTSIDINREILKLCTTPQIKTGIIYKTNINFSLGLKYLGHLVDNELLIKINKHYETTQKGINVLNDLVGVDDSIGLINI